MKIGIYGGTFDPIHIGHTFLVNHLINSGILDRVIITVAGDPPHKPLVYAHEKDRLNMTRLSFESDKISVSDYEITNKEKSYTYNTMNHFKKLFPHDEVYFVTGADAFADLPLWYNGEKLIQENKFIAVNRSDSFNSSEYLARYRKIVEQYGCHPVEVDIKTPDISSTQLRKMIKDGKDCKKYIPERAYLYILKKGIYR